VYYAKTDGYKRGAGAKLALSSLEDFKKVSAPAKEYKKNRSQPHYPV
jgi:hypothetical protein